MATTGKGSGEGTQHPHEHDHQHHRHRSHRHRHHRHRRGHVHRQHRHRRRHDHAHYHQHNHTDPANINLSEVQPSNVEGIEIYADAVCSKRNEGNCGYGIVCDNPKTRIAEPLSTSGKGEKHFLLALLYALQFAQGVRARDVTIYLPFSPIVHYYNHWLHRWMARGFRRRSGAPHVPGHTLWNQIFMSKMSLMDHGVELHVEHMKRKSDEKMREAYSLAQLGTQMHVVCPLCKRTHARQFNSHGCEPICNYDNCKDKRFDNLAEYQDHLEMWHRRDCPSPDCEEGLGIYSDRELRRHLMREHGMKYGCDFCGRLFDCKVRFMSHVKKCPQGEKCRDCGLRFTNRRQANIHRERAAHGDFDDEDDYDSDASSRSSISSTTTTSSFSSDYDMLTFTTSRYR